MGKEFKESDGEEQRKERYFKTESLQNMSYLYPFLFVVPQLSKAERMVVTVSEIVRILIEAHEKGEDINLNRYISNNNNNLLSVTVCVCVCVLCYIIKWVWSH